MRGPSQRTGPAFLTAGRAQTASPRRRPALISAVLTDGLGLLQSEANQVAAVSTPTVTVGKRRLLVARPCGATCTVALCSDWHAAPHASPADAGRALRGFAGL